MTRRLFVTCVVIASVVAGILLSNSRPELDERAFRGAQRAQFKDLSGNWQQISSWEGSYRIVNFWATWCPPCLEEIPLFVRLQDEFGDRNVTFIGIALDDVDRVREFVGDNEINYPILIGSGDALRISEILGNQRSGLPFTVFLSPSGDLVDIHSGAVPESKIRQFVDKIR
ncbi:MAG: TlpA disulfide reductase family protein [Proteobacteria bacterium]|nr:TlpA disulfide reductase family protein [Pseudomonadota bacterium]MDA1332196.1 TlpA disulfide reductase family protein [Pseudomonadota bacterium]